MNSAVRKAVIPIAGLGTRHFPASHAVKKELFPVVGAGRHRPRAVPLSLARTRRGGHRGNLHHRPARRRRNGAQLSERAGRRISETAGKTSGVAARGGADAQVRQTRNLRRAARQEGYGHAVYQTKKFAGGEMVLLGLGDHLFRGKPVSPYSELARDGNRIEKRSVSAVNRIGADELKGYGTIAGRPRGKPAPD